MAIYSLARRTTNTTSGQAAHSILTSSTLRVAVLECGIFMAAATASTYLMGRPAAAGVGAQTSPVLLQAEDPAAPVSLTNSALAYATSSPTSPTNPFRRWASPATIGTGVIWTFPRGILVAVSSEFIVSNGATDGVVDTYFTVDE